MKQRIYFNAFHMNCVVHQSPGLWVRSDDHMVDYKDLNQWIAFAKLIERGCFDAVFLADVIGTYDVYGGNRDAAVANAAQVPVNDPMLLSRRWRRRLRTSVSASPARSCSTIRSPSPVSSPRSIT